MTVDDYLRVARERWKIVVTTLLIGAILAAAVFFVRPPQYTASVTLYVSAQTRNDPQQAFQGAQLSEQRVKSYNELVTGSRVMGETVRRLGLGLTSEQLAARVTASSPLDSVIIDVAVTDNSPQQAAAIANAIATVTSEVVDELERPAIPGEAPPVVVRIVQPAAIPDQPSSMSLSIVLAIGLVAGLATGFCAAFLRHALDTSVKTLAALSDAVGAPGLGITTHDPAMQQRPLIVHDDQTPNAEAFRRLRTNLQFIDVDVPRKVLLITSALSGEGKTTGVANLAIAMASMSSRVLVIEADLRRPKLSALLDMDRSVGLTRVLSGRVGLPEAIQSWAGGTFDVLASGPTPPNPSELLASNQMRSLLDDVRGRYDVVLVDTPPLLPVSDAAALAPATDGVVLFCRSNSTTRAQVESAAAALRAVSVEPLAAVLTMARRDRGVGDYATYSIRSESHGQRPSAGHASVPRDATGLDGATERNLHSANTALRATPDRVVDDHRGRYGRR